jgi:hypothetical protein
MELKKGMDTLGIVRVGKKFPSGADLGFFVR